MGGKGPRHARGRPEVREGLFYPSFSKDAQEILFFIFASE